ncbi:hypothetical protein [Sinorhizobium chiapasense]|uniref:Holin n=1 Tax=Sinorhizobium chiapasense TaxID=501572 RepID=A0ABZ2BCW5_9HYPH
MTFWDFVSKAWDWAISSGKGEVAIAGIAGSAVSVALEWTGVMSGFRRLFVGATTAFFLSPVGVPLFQWAFGTIDIPPDQAAGVSGFVTGLSGIIIVETFLTALRLRKHELAGDRHEQN